MQAMGSGYQSHLLGTVSREKKEHFLAAMSEDEFREKVVRPVFERRQLKFVRHTCGADEEGKDCICIGEDRLGRRMVYAIQTKRGNLNLASKATDNLTNALTQVRTALETDIHLTEEKTKVRPDVVILVASGTINNQARRHIHDHVNDPRVDFMDANSLIPVIDDVYPELWFGIDAQKFPYLRRLKEELLRSSDTIAISELGIEGGPYCPVTDDAYVVLFVHRIQEEVVKSSVVERISDQLVRKPQVRRRPKIDQIPFAQLLTRPERIVCVTGDGGSGKTTAIRRLAYQLADEGLATAAKATRVPIVLKAAEVAASVARLVEIAGQATAKLSGNDAACFSAKDLADGNVVLLVDALDEVVGANLRNVVLDKIIEFREEFGKCLVILTTRHYSSIRKLAALSRFTRYELSSIDLRQAAKIVDRISQGRRLSGEGAKEMLRRLQDVHGISLNPMLVTVFVATSDNTKKDIPPNITEIFKKFTEEMLGRWDAKKGLAQQYQATLKDFLLCEVAFAMHSARCRSIPLSECHRLISDALSRKGYEADLDVLFDEAVYRSNLLRVEEDRVEFTHHILQEFFAGRGAPNAEFFESVVADEWWRKPMVFFFGEHAQDNVGLTKLMEAADRLTPVDRYDAAITLGLAVQACFLTDMVDKVNSLEWVVRCLAAVCDPVIEAFRSKADFELYMFIAYYLGGRDAVASNCIRGVAERLAHNSKDPNDERSMFWCIAGLVEAGHLTAAEQMIERFKPEDKRLLLALHLGAFFIANLRISTDEDKKVATRICRAIGPKIEHLIQETVKQWDSYLLEMRDGEISVASKDEIETESPAALEDHAGSDQAESENDAVGIPPGVREMETDDRTADEVDGRTV